MEHLREFGVPLGDRIRILNLRGTDLPTKQRENAVELPGNPAQELSEIRQVTVLFADLVGSTELATNFDVEDSHAVLRSFHERCGEVVRANGGVTSRFIGDAVLACFGVPQAKEDDASRAVSAAEQIAAEVPMLRVNIDFLPLTRVGVATGLVMTGNLLTEGQKSFGPASGATLNLAARLQALAMPNTVLIDQITRDLLPATRECEFLGERELKGFAEAQPIWKLDCSLHNSVSEPAGSLSDAPHFVGRRSELATLDRSWVESERNGSIVLVAGEPGIGKSRLLDEFVRRAAVPPNKVIRMECLANGQVQPLRPCLRCLKHVLGAAMVPLIHRFAFKSCRDGLWRI